MKTTVIETISRRTMSLISSAPQVHSHTFHELYYMANGSATYYIDSRIYHIQSGNFVFIPKGIAHKTTYENHADNERLLLNFSDAIFTTELHGIKKELCSTRILYIPEEMIPYFEDLLKQIEAESDRKDECSTIMLNLYITQLLVQLCRYKYHVQPVLSGADQTIYEISKYLRLHFNENISLNLLSHEFSMSESHLSRIFKAHTGIGINEYLTYVRITNAEKLLKETDLPIAQIAQQCGYDDSNYFSTVFKRIKNITPQKYRKL